MSAINSFIHQAPHGLGSIEGKGIIENNTKYPVDVLGVLRSLGRQPQPRMSAETLLIPMTDLTLLHNDSVNAFELSHSDRRLNIAHAEVPAELFVDEAPFLVETQIAQLSAAIRECLVVRKHHTAFAGRYLLIRIETDSGDVAQRTDGSSFVGLAVLVRSIVDAEQTMSTCQLD